MTDSISANTKGVIRYRDEYWRRQGLGSGPIEEAHVYTFSVYEEFVKDAVSDGFNSVVKHHSFVPLSGLSEDERIVVLSNMLMGWK